MTQNNTVVSEEAKQVIRDFIHPINLLMAECAEKYTSPILLLGTLKDSKPIVFFQLEDRIFSIYVTPDNYYRIVVYNSDFTAFESRPSVIRDDLNMEIFDLLGANLKDKNKSKIKVK